MSYNPPQSKPYVFFKSTNENTLYDPEVDTITYNVDYPTVIDKDYVLGDTHGAGSYENVTNQFSFGTSTFLLADTLLGTGYTDQYRSTTVFRDENNNQVGIRGQELSYNARLSDSASVAVMNNGVRSTQRCDEFPRLMADPNKNYKLTLGVYQHSLSSSRWNTSLGILIAFANKTVVFGFVI
tara:strand:+ start:56 stop:601 length:546 start_codon:yes stop_codon:yes gene_type:complete